MPNLWEQMSGQAGAEAATAQQMPEQAKLQNQTMQQNLRQQQIMNQQMQRLNNPQIWKDTATTMDQVIAATPDPSRKAWLTMMRGQVASGMLSPPDMLKLMQTMNEEKARLEEARAQQALAAAALSNATTGVVSKAGSMMPGSAAPATGMPPVRAGGGNHIGVATAPDGKDHNVLLDASGNIISDLGPAGP